MDLQIWNTYHILNLLCLCCYHHFLLIKISTKWQETLKLKHSEDSNEWPVNNIWLHTHPLTSYSILPHSPKKQLLPIRILVTINCRYLLHLQPCPLFFLPTTLVILCRMWNKFLLNPEIQSMIPIRKYDIKCMSFLPYSVTSCSWLSGYFILLQHNYLHIRHFSPGFFEQKLTTNNNMIKI